MSDTPSTDNRRTRKRQQTSEHLVDVAFGLFATHGFDQVSMEQIAAAADVARGTLYNHFPVKEAILAHRFHAELAESLQSLVLQYGAQDGCVSRLRAFLHGVAAATERHRGLMGPYLRYRLGHPVAVNEQGPNSIELIYGKLLAEGQASGELRSDLRFDQLIATLGFMHLAAMLRWVHASDSSLTAEFDAMLELFLNGAGAQEAKA